MDSVAILCRGIKEYYLNVLFSRGEYHTVGIYTEEFCGLEVSDEDYRLSYELVGSIEFSYAGNDLALLKSEIYLKLKELLGLRNGLALKHLGNTKINLGEFIKGDLGLNGGSISFLFLRSLFLSCSLGLNSLEKLLLINSCKESERLAESCA